MPWLTPNLFKQGPTETFRDIPRFGDGPSQVSFRHVLHVYRDRNIAENTSIQSVTFKTISIAREVARPSHDVRVVAVTYPEDRDMVPDDIEKAADLDRTVLDVASFASPRPLPLLFDILMRGARHEFAGYNAEREYIVFTNSDIHIQPAFYCAMGELIERGYDVVTVTRRTIDGDARVFSWTDMIDQGENHRGHDCFVFPASMLRDFVLTNACCGIAGVMRSMLYNLAACAQRMLMLSRAQMTFHLGNDKFWANPQFADYKQFNLQEGLKVVAAHPEGSPRRVAVEKFIDSHAVFMASWPSFR